MPVSSSIPKVYVARLFKRAIRAKQIREVRGQVLTVPCLEWQGAKDQKGYGVIRLQEGTMGVPSGIVRVHRLSFWIARGPFPINCEIDHICRNRKCIEETHLILLGPTEHARLSNLDRWQEVGARLEVLPPASDSDEVL